jgi:uncharacterized protein YdbL (DUF1318 family)
MRQRSSDRRSLLLSGAAAVLALGLGGMGWPGPARAQAALDSFRASGVIAERFDGYVELRESGAPAEARALVDSVNAERRKLYEKRAGELGVPVSEVGKVFAEKILQVAPAGTYFRQPGGGYVRK